MKWFRRKDQVCLYWEHLLARLGVPGVSIRDVVQAEDGYRVHGRLGHPARGCRPVDVAEARKLAPRIAVHKRLPEGAVCIGEDPAGGHAADFIIHVRPAVIRPVPGS